MKTEAQRLGAAAQYGWGHTIDFGPFAVEGLFGDQFLHLAGAFDSWGWWPGSLAGMRVADVGCYTGGVALLMAARGADRVYAVDEVGENLEQCTFVARAFGMHNVETVHRSVYDLGAVVERGSLDVIVLAGVLYHLSDMLVGMYALRELLKPGGVLLVETAAVEDFQHSYANFSRFIGGGWWNPTALCIEDMCEFTGFDACEIRFYRPDRCFMRARRSAVDIPFRRGMNWSFDSVRDLRERSMDTSEWKSAPWDPAFRRRTPDRA